MYPSQDLTISTYNLDSGVGGPYFYGIKISQHGSVFPP